MKKCSVNEELMMCAAYRYAIGRNSYITTLAYHIASVYYDKLSDERLEFTAQDIRKHIEDCLRFNNPSFSYDGSVSYDERNAIVDYIKWLNKNVENKDDLLNIKSIKCYKEDYSKEYPKLYEVIKSSKVSFLSSEFDLQNLLIWESLASFFDKKNYKKIKVVYEGKEQEILCFECWEKYTEYRESDKIKTPVPWAYTKVYRSVDDFLHGRVNSYINPDYIVW